jgi:hypothetical protein
MALPVPSPANPQTFPFYENWFAQHYGASAGNAYYSLAAQAPNATPNQVAEALSTEIVGRGLARAIGDVASGTLAATSLAANSGFGITPSGLGLGLGGPGTLPAQSPGSSSGSSGGGSDWQHLLIRIAEFALGGGLVLIGVSAIVKATPAGKAATNTGKKAVGIAGMIPK